MHSGEDIRLRTRKNLRANLVLSGCAFFVGCSHAQSYNILGSYFPAWLLCTVVGVILTFLTFLLLQRFNWDQRLSPPLLVYPSLTAVFTLALWLLLFN